VWENSEIESAAALLGALLQSLRAEDEVILTKDQRKRLHELVMPGRWDPWFMGAGGVGGKYTMVFQTLRHNLRPAAIGALGLLGDSSSIPVLERFARKTDDPDLLSDALRAAELEPTDFQFRVGAPPAAKQAAPGRFMDRAT